MCTGGGVAFVKTAKVYLDCDTLCVDVQGQDYDYTSIGFALLKYGMTSATKLKLSVTYTIIPNCWRRRNERHAI